MANREGQQVDTLPAQQYGWDGAAPVKINCDSSGNLIITDIPSGASANGTRDLTSANTWYAVPSTVPTSDYILIAVIENATGSVRMGFDNTGTPSATNGVLAPGLLEIRLKANQSVYYASDVAGDDVNWTTKEI